ncbi:hypothetical protein F0562_006014 [Nyssa sinensis]|uniref:Secreted protein n=1 Tax=Nyssa sinensis TaxID=561372 RepID=A0A5J5AJR7_9ASTE|nr:hypothetical protein F0562_006014 [Nyssa sinensis]
MLSKHFRMLSQVLLVMLLLGRLGTVVVGIVGECSGAEGGDIGSSIAAADVARSEWVLKVLLGAVHGSSSCSRGCGCYRLRVGQELLHQGMNCSCGQQT